LVSCFKQSLITAILLSFFEFLITATTNALRHLNFDSWIASSNLVTQK
jgi:hypothetical protein